MGFYLENRYGPANGVIKADIHLRVIKHKWVLQT